MESGDQTDILREGYWASYNVPFYEDIYYRSGYAAAEEKTGANVYQLGPRPKIFRRDQSNVRWAPIFILVLSMWNRKISPHRK